MKAVILNGPNNFDVTELPKPEIGDGDILLEMKKAAICGTDMRILAGTKTKGVRYPSVIGHEMCGVIAEVGKDVKGYEVGEKVSIANVIPCGSCPACLAGRENACMNRKAIGYEFDGGFEEYIRIPEIAIKSGNVVKLPEDVSFTAGALIEPLACCIRGLKNAGTGFNDTVLIVGAGPIGLMHMQLAKIAGAKELINWAAPVNAVVTALTAIMSCSLMLDAFGYVVSGLYQFSQIKSYIVYAVIVVIAVILNVVAGFTGIVEEN